MGQFLDEEAYVPKGQFLEDQGHVGATESVSDEAPEEYYLSTPKKRTEWQAQGPVGWFEYAKMTRFSDVYYGEVMGAGSLYGLTDRLQKDEYKDEKAKGNDMQALNEIMVKREEMQTRGMSIGANIYKVVAQIPSFAMEMVLTGGLATSARKTTTAIAKKAGVSAVGKGAVRKGLAVLGREAVVGAARTTVMPHRYAANYAERQVNDVLAITDKGIEFLEDGNEAPLQTFMKAYGDTFVEYYTETLGGELLSPASKVAGKGILARMPKSVQKSFINLAETLKKAIPEGRITELITRGGFDGILEEFGEERLGGLLRIPLGLDERDIPTLDKLQEAVFPTWEQALIEIGAFSIWGGGSASAQMISNHLRNRGRGEADIKKTLNNLSQKEKDAFALQLGETFDERVERAEVIIKATAGADLTQEEQQMLAVVYNEFVKKGLVEKIEKDKYSTEVTDEYEETLSQFDLKFEGIQKNKAGDPVLVMFTDKESGSTLALKPAEFSEQSVFDKLNRSQDSYKKAQAIVEANQKEISKPKVTKETVKTTASGRTILEKQISEIESRLEQVNLAQDSLAQIEDIRKNFKNLIRKDLREELAGLPSYYAKRKGGISWDEATEEMREMGVDIQTEADMIEYLKNIDNAKTRLEKFIQENKAKLITKKETTVINQRIRDIERGIRAGKSEQKKETKVIQKKLIDLLKASGLEANDKAKFISTIKNIQTIDQLKKAIPKIIERIAKLGEAAEKRGLVKKIIKRPKRPENIVDVKYQERIDEILNKLGETKKDRTRSLKSMSVDELLDIAEKIALLEEEGKTVFKSKKAQRAMASEVLRGALIKAVGGTGTVEGLTKGTKEEKKAKKVSHLTQAQLNFMSPLNLVRKVFGEVGERMFYDSIDHAYTKKGISLNERKKRIEAVAKKLDIDVLKLGEAIEINGKTFQVNDILRMYLATKDKQSMEALEYGNNITAEQVNDFIEKVDSKYIKFADEVQKIVAEKYQNIADVMAEYYNVKVEKVKTYFPLRRIARGKTQEEVNDSLETEMVQEQAIRKGQGFAYTTVDKGNTISRQDIDKQFQSEISTDFLGDAMRIIDKQEHLIAFAPLQKAFNKAVNDLALQDAVKYNYGESTWRQINDYLLVAVNPDVMWSNLDSVTRFVNLYAKGVRRGVAKAYLSYNAVTALKQLPSATLALKYTNPVQLEESMRHVAISKAYREKIYQLDPSLRNRVVSRDFNELMTEVGRLPEGSIKRELVRLSQVVDKGGFAMIMGMDTFAVLSVYDAVYKHQIKTKSENEAKDIAHKAVIETQPQGQVKDLPAMYRSNNEFIRMMIMFTNQLNKIWNMMSVDMPREVARKEYAQASAGIASVMLSSTLIYIASHGGLPDDPIEFIEAIFGSAISSVPIIGNLAMSMMRGYSPSISPASGIIQSAERLAKDIENGDYQKAMKDSAFLLAVFLELPYAQPKRTIEGAIALATGETSDIRRLIWSEYALNNK